MGAPGVGNEGGGSLHSLVPGRTRSETATGAAVSVSAANITTVTTSEQAGRRHEGDGPDPLVPDRESRRLRMRPPTVTIVTTPDQAGRPPPWRDGHTRRLEIRTIDADNDRGCVILRSLRGGGGWYATVHRWRSQDVNK